MFTYGARTTLASDDARALARMWLTMTQPEFSTTFRGSAVSRAKHRGPARLVAVALGNVGTAACISVHKFALAHDEQLVREHAA